MHACERGDPDLALPGNQAFQAHTCSIENAKDDLEMEDAEAASGPSTEPAGKELSEKAFNLPEQLRRNLALLEQAVALKELRLISGRLQRQTAAVRRELTAPVLLIVVQDSLPAGTPMREQLLQHLQLGDCA